MRRMQAVVGQEAPFDHGRQQMKLLADLEVTTKAVERTAEAIGEDIAAREQREIQRAMQLDLPMVVGEPIPILYVQMDGTGVPVVKKETVGRQGQDRRPAGPHAGGQVGMRLHADRHGTKKATPSAIRIPPPTPAPSRPPKSSASAFTWKPGSAAGAAPQKKVVMGDGAEWIWNLADQHFPGAVQIVDLYHARQHLWELARKLYPNDAGEPESLDEGPPETPARQGKNRKAGARASLHRFHQSRSCSRRFAPRRTTLRETPSACATPSSAASTCSSAPA